MDIKPISNSPIAGGIPRTAPPTGQPAAGFGDMLSGTLNNLNNLQARADELGVRMVLDKDVDLHDAVLANEESSLAFQYTLQVRNKIIEAYQEVMRMQV